MRALSHAEKGEGYWWFPHEVIFLHALEVGSRAQVPKRVKKLEESTDRRSSFLNNHFSDSLDLFIEIQQKACKSGMWEITFRSRNPKGEIASLCVLNFRERQTEHQQGNASRNPST